jgi:hypothetical protein
MADITLPFSENLPGSGKVAFQITVNGVPHPTPPVLTTNQPGIPTPIAVGLPQAAINGATDMGIGVWGNAVDGCGVVGISTGIPATGGTGVYGNSGNGYGVWGVSAANPGIYGQSTSFDAVVGETQSDAHAGVTGRNMTTGANGGVGIYGVGGKFAGKFDGDVQINGIANTTSLAVNLDTHVHRNLIVGGECLFTGAVQVPGTITVGGDIVLTNQDCAEDFDIELGSGVEPGTVMVLDCCALLQESRHAYDKKVAGVISGAGEFRPGLILGREKGQGDSRRAAVALIGKVYCKVDAQFGEIGVGDLLTTSLTAGHAMKAEDPLKAFGATIGKALAPLKTGRGLIPILVALQ